LSFLAEFSITLASYSTSKKLQLQHIMPALMPDLILRMRQATSLPISITMMLILLSGAVINI